MGQPDETTLRDRIRLLDLHSPVDGSLLEVLLIAVDDSVEEVTVCQHPRDERMPGRFSYSVVVTTARGDARRYEGTIDQPGG